MFRISFWVEAPDLGLFLRKATLDLTRPPPAVSYMYSGPNIASFQVSELFED